MSDMDQMRDRFGPEQAQRLAELGMRSVGAAHDLSNVLQVAGSGLNLLERELRAVSGQQLGPIVQAIRSSLEEAGQIGRSLLNHGRSEPSPLEVNDLAACVKSMSGRIGLLAGTGVALTIAAREDVPPVVCDGRAFEHALLNLVANARNAMPGGGSIMIEVFRSASVSGGTEEAIVRVSDDGCGMPEDMCHAAFRPFVTGRPGRGTGLGLALVEAFARASGGSVQLASRPGRGTAVTLRLPVCGGGRG